MPPTPDVEPALPYTVNLTWSTPSEDATPGPVYWAPEAEPETPPTAGASEPERETTVERAAEPEPTQSIPIAVAAPVTPPFPPPVDHRPGADPGPSRRRSHRSATLTSRTVLVTCLAALTSVLVTAAVAFPLAVRASNRAARQVLADKASIAAQAVVPRGGGLGLGLGVGAQAAQEVRVLRKQGVDAYLIRGGRATPAGLPDRFVAAISAGQDVSGATAVINSHQVLVEGRAVANGAGIVLVSAANSPLPGSLLARLLFALLAGLLAGALAGALLARRIARPIRNAAEAAARLSAGDRSIRLRPEPPAEAENLAHALNELSAALTVSEGRQRDFLLSISHELRTPLTSLKGYAEALADGVVSADGARRAGQTMVVEAGHLERLITDLLALARLDAADFPVESVPVELTHLIRGVVEAWAARWAAAGLVLRTELPTVPVIVYTDPGRIRQVVDGLLENALRVVPAGAPIVLSVRGPSATVPEYGLIEVRDGGPGFTDADLAVVFERGALYERYRGVRQVGSGLGLALAAGLVRRLGGFIEAGHAPEGGAWFTVALPTLAAVRR